MRGLGRIVIVTAMAVLFASLCQAQSSPAVLQWMVGCWAGDSTRARVEERWVDTGTGTLVGLGTTVADGRLTEFEFLRIVTDGASLVYLAQPGGASPTRFTSASNGHEDVVFENPQHDYPKRVGYRRTGDTLLAWIDGGDGDSRRRDFPMKKASCDR